MRCSKGSVLRFSRLRLVQRLRLLQRLVLRLAVGQGEQVHELLFLAVGAEAADGVEGLLDGVQVEEVVL